MRNGLVIADSGPIFSLSIIDKLHILENIFDSIKIPVAVWNEITINKENKDYQGIHSFFADKVVAIKGFNKLTLLMDYGESESAGFRQKIITNVEPGTLKSDLTV